MSLWRDDDALRRRFARELPRELLMGAARVVRKELPRVDPCDVSRAERDELRQLEREVHAFRCLGE